MYKFHLFKERIATHSKDAAIGRRNETYKISSISDRLLIDDIFSIGGLGICSYAAMIGKNNDGFVYRANKDPLPGTHIVTERTSSSLLGVLESRTYPSKKITTTDMQFLLKGKTALEMPQVDVFHILRKKFKE